MYFIRKLELNQLSQNEIDAVTKLDLYGNQITIIPDCIGRLTNLQTLWLHDNQITIIPDCFELLTNLQELCLSRNQITTIPNCLGLLINLQTLHLSYNKITTIPDCIGLLTNLQILSFYDNKITTIPNSIGLLTNLQKLYLHNNQITAIPDCIELLTNLQKLYIGTNQITTIPDSVGLLTNLQTLNLDSNQITTIPNCIGRLTILQELDLSYNQITTIPDCIGLLTNLQTLYLQYNQISTIPASLGRLTRCTIYLSGNPIEHIPPNVQRLLNQQKTQNNIYNDTQNVHDHNIQDSIRQSIYSILNDTCSNNNFIEELLHSSLQSKTKQILTEYCNDHTIHFLNFTFSELFKYVWNRITKHEYKEEILKILDDEMANAECKCFTGRISRLVNVLNGYYDDVNIKISDNAQIGTIISIIKQQYTGNDVDELKKLIIDELKDRNITDTIIEEWIEYIDI